MKLDIGSGGPASHRGNGWLGVDKYCPTAEICADLWDLPFQDNSVDEIFSSHALEHISKREVLPTLREWFRVLCPGGKASIRVPDLQWCCNHFLNNPTTGWDLDVLFGNQNHSGEFHKTGFTEEILLYYVQQAGFTSNACDRAQSHGQISLSLDCYKPVQAQRTSKACDPNRDKHCGYNFQIYTMYVNRQDLLNDALQRIDFYHDRVVVIDNSLSSDLRLPGFKGEIVKPPVPLFLNQTYNYIMQLCKQRGQNVCLMMHSDAQASNAAIEQLLNTAHDLDQAGRSWGVLFTNYDVLCAFNVRTVHGLKWDMYLPLSFTDVDYYHRVRAAGLEVIETKIEVGHATGGSSSIKSDTALTAFVNTNWPAWAAYYQLKWGGERAHEQNLIPFVQI